MFKYKTHPGLPTGDMGRGSLMTKLLDQTFLANQVPLAWVTHSLEWMPVSIQIPGRLAPVLNYNTPKTVC